MNNKKAGQEEKKVKPSISSIADQAYKDFYTKDIIREGQSEPEHRIVVQNEGLGHKIISTLYDINMDTDSLYRFSRDCLSDLADQDPKDMDEARSLIGEMADNDTDVYTGDLTEWLNASNYNVYYLGEAITEYQPEDGFKALALAQMKAREEIYNKVLDFIEAQLTSEQEEPTGSYECAECGYTDHATSECPNKAENKEAV